MSTQQRRRRRAVQDEDEDEDEDMQHRPPESPDNADSDGDEPMAELGPRDETGSLVKNLVRYALACEYSRTPIRRDGIKEKVLGPNGRAFRKVFAGAQKQLRATFGMEMVELPTRDRNLMTAEQKRKAAKSQTQKEPTSNAYTLVSILPEALRTPAILPPSKIHSPDGEASYIALYTLLIAIITLSGGALSDPRLRRHLARLNAADNVPGTNPRDETAPAEKTEVVLQRMLRQGYLVKVTESRGGAAAAAGDDEATTWHVGPRGKVEVDKEAIAAVVRTVYGGSSEELERRLQMSLKVRERKPAGVAAAAREVGGEEQEEAEQAEEEGPPDGDPGPSTRRSGRRRRAEVEEEEGE